MRFLLLLCLPAVLSAKPLIEAKAGYFFFTSSPLNDVDTHGGFDGQLVFSYPVSSLWHVYSSIEYVQKSGKSLSGHQHTSIWMLPISAGIKPVFPISSKVEYYLAIGPKYFFAYAHNDSSYVPKRMSSNGLGGFLNTGFLFSIYSHCTLDVFGEYSYAKLTFQTSKKNTEGHRVAVSGLSFGMGLGYSF